MSLKSSLQRMILERGYLSLSEVEVFCRENKYKLSNAERRLRKSESPTIESVEKNGAIIGYRPRNTLKENSPAALINEMQAFKPKVKEKQGLF